MKVRYSHLLAWPSKNNVSLYIVAMSECYICCDDQAGPVFRVCACTNHFIHEHCFVRLLEHLPSHTCPTCKTEFTPETTHTVHLTPMGACFLAILATGMVTNACITSLERQLRADDDVRQFTLSLRDSLEIVRTVACVASVVVFFLRDPFATRRVHLIANHAEHMVHSTGTVTLAASAAARLRR